LNSPENDLIYVLGHDLRAPVVNFRGFLGRLQRSCEELRAQAAGWPLTPEQRNSADRLLEQKVGSSLEVLDRTAQKMDRLVGALLELSRAGRDPVQLEPVAVSDLVGSLGEEYQQQASAKGVGMRWASAPTLCADRGRLEQILRRLLDNALKFLDPQRPGRIEMGGAIIGREATCWVRDNGIGIREEHFERIFLPFGRIRQVEAPGEGVGLAIARKLAAQMGGSIRVESTHGQGSTFWLHLPVGEASEWASPVAQEIL